MHTAYRLYNLLCTLHFPIAILVLLGGFKGSFHFLDIETASIPSSTQFISYYYYYYHDLTLTNSKDETDNATSINKTLIPLVVVEKTVTLSASYFISSISACIYALIYLSFFHSASSDSKQSISNIILASSYYYHQSRDSGNDEEQTALLLLMGDGESQGNAHPAEISKWSSLMMLSEMVYWSFFIAYSYTAMASNTLHLGTLELLYLRLLVHLFCVYTICSQNNRAHSSGKRVDITGSIAFIALIGETFIVISMTSTQINLVMAYFHRFLDFLLVLGHRWDMNPSWEIILNCRLFFIAIGGALLHANIFLSSSVSRV